MLDIYEITYFQYKKNVCLGITTFDHPLHIRPILEFLAQCASWRGFGITVRFTQYIEAPNDTQLGVLINYNVRNSYTNRNHYEIKHS